MIDFDDFLDNEIKFTDSKRDCALKAWNQKQADIDELRKRIDEVLSKSKDFYDFGDGESAMAFCNEIINILKGDRS